MKKINPENTPLARAVKYGEGVRVSPLDILKLARSHWLKGKKISIDKLANESGVSRITVYRWVGNRDCLIGEVLWSAIEPGLKKIINETPGTGIEHIVEVHRQLMVMVLSFPPMQKFIDDDPAYALRIITTDASCLRERSVKALIDHLADQESKGYIKLPAPAEELGELIFRTNESRMYSDAISGRNQAIEQACQMIRVLLSSGTDVKKKKTTR